MENCFMKLITLMLSLFVQVSFASDLLTHAEKTGWKETGRAAESERLCHEFQKQFPQNVKCKTYGITPDKRDLKYMIVGDPKLPIVWVQAGIHAGEIDGKDAVFLLIREILQNKFKSDPLKGLCLVFIPIVNLDGHERFGKWNRPNQIGPEEMGWRTTAQNYNMNRDFLKADTSEMNDLLQLWHTMNPVLSLDLHVTDGAQFQPEVGFIVQPNGSFGDSSLHVLGTQYETALVEKMNSAGFKALPFYPSFEVEDDPSSGFARYVSTPRFAHGYWFNNNRLGMLVETHSWKDYATRVRTHHDTVLFSLELAKVNAAEWKKASKELDEQNLSGKNVDLSFKHTEKSTIIDFPGYKYTKEKSVVSGEDVIRYDITEKQTWRIPFYEELKPSLSIIAPNEGYFIPASESWLLQKLDLHKIKYTQALIKDLQDVLVFRANKVSHSPVSSEGHQTATVEGDWQPQKMQLSPGTIFVPIYQPRARLLMHLLEPESPDSLVSWGFFNRFFERKEYMENYVTEDVAREMLKSESIKTEFDQKLNDKEFAKDSGLRFDFFYRKHPSWDDRFNRYPIFRR